MVQWAFVVSTALIRRHVTKKRNLENGIRDKQIKICGSSSQHFRKRKTENSHCVFGFTESFTNYCFCTTSNPYQANNQKGRLMTSLNFFTGYFHSPRCTLLSIAYIF
ncbi:hypothetical protein D915_010691 [Fasciola hepatica]|uniref:Uncharacterized protein n=1 Tax=Fasciola hepatica TaxID=6192 RepID=A0A4E0QT53_FASHE|nr:hypothetical protein D915_010691 [Fasciola hepatica]